MFRMLRSNKGTIMVELVASCLILVVFFCAVSDVFCLIRDQIYIQRVVRDGAREAAILGDTSMGKEKARDRAMQYFGSKDSLRHLEIQEKTEGNITFVVCQAEYPHRFYFSRKEMGLNAQATYGWWDTVQDYEK